MVGTPASGGLKLGFTNWPGLCGFLSEGLADILRVGATRLVGILAPSFRGGGPG